MSVHVVRVHLTQDDQKTQLQVEDSPIKRYYLNGEVEDMAVCAALESIAQRVARQELAGGDGFTVKVEFVRAGSTQPEAAPPDAQPAPITKESSPPPKPRYSLSQHRMTRCHANDDGMCDDASICPQLRDGEPARSGRHCPLDKDDGE